MPKYKLAIFDLDGTLSDSFPWFLRVVNSIADKHRLSIANVGVRYILDRPAVLKQAKTWGISLLGF